MRIAALTDVFCLLNTMTEIVLIPEEPAILQRRQLVEQARANLRAQGVVLSPKLYRLYEYYVQGTYTRQQIRAEVETYWASFNPATSSQLNSPTI